MIPYGRQQITAEDIAAVIAVLQSDFLTQGPAVQRFEESVATACGAQYALAANSATSALHIACLALGLGPGDWLWTSPNTFVASANCALYCGAQVDFVDIDPVSYNLCPAKLEAKLIEAERARCLPKVVIAVHFSGQPCDMVAIHILAQRYGFRIIEDASHAIGATYQGQPVGAGTHSDITVFSFHPVKIITTGEGGMALTNDANLAQQMNLFRSHGITRDPELMTHSPDGPWYYQQVALGFNYRMTDIQAALGMSQLQRLKEYVDRRTDLARRYDQLFADLPLVIPRQRTDVRSAWHLYVIRLTQQVRKSHREVFDALRAAGIGVNLHYIPVHLQPHFQAIGFREGQFPEAEAYYRSVISLPMFAGLTDAQQQEVVSAVREVIAA